MTTVDETTTTPTTQTSKGRPADEGTGHRSRATDRGGRPGKSGGRAEISGDAHGYRVRSLTKVSDTDVERVHRLVGELLDQGAAIGWVTTPDRQAIRAWLTELAVGTIDGDACLLLLDRVSTDGSSDVVGFAYWTRRSSETERVHADVEKVAVSARARGRGLGRRIVSALVDRARDADVEVVTLDVRGNNHAAMELYESLGFVEYGRIPDFVAIGDDRWDNVYFALDLRGGDEDIQRHGDTPRGPGASRRRRRRASSRVSLRRG